MEPIVHPESAGRSSEVLLARRETGLQLLREAYEAARSVNRDLWEFAVEMAEMRAAGLTRADLRWLLCEGFALHAREALGAGNGKRVFQHIPGLALPEGSCFVLASRGLGPGMVRFDPPGGERGTPHLLGGTSPSRGIIEVPCWNGTLRELTWQGQLVKKFRLPAENQEAILDQFEKEGWPLRIEDPLARLAGQDPKSRLHDAIKGLNRNQVNQLLRFRGDGSGQGVLWSLMQRA